MAIQKLDVEFKTIDGLTLRGDLYPAPASVEKSPGVVITPGVSPSEESLREQT
jgi:hypothetical protein